MKRVFPVFIVVVLIIATIIGFIYLKQLQKNDYKQNDDIYIDIEDDNDTNSSREKLNSQLAIIYKNNLTIASYDLSKGKKLSQITLKKGNVSADIDLSEYNPYKMIEIKNKLYVLNPSQLSVDIYEINEDNFPYEKSIGLIGSPVDFKIKKGYMYVSYLNSNNIEKISIYNSNDRKMYSFDEDVESFEVREKNIYAGIGENLVIMDMESYSTKKIYLGGKAGFIYASDDGFIYVGNRFGESLNNSLLMKINVGEEKIVDLIELNKAFPFLAVEKNQKLYVLLKGIKSNEEDGLAVVDLKNFKAIKNILTSDSPNFAHLINDELYVSHDNGQISVVDLNKNRVINTLESNGVGSIILKEIKVSN